ncbi:MAG: hypothetical protein SVP26_05700 [Chloroflexota bacterium]|nr:hypothetical protein [Chloroflexota bacterium]
MPRRKSEFGTAREDFLGAQEQVKEEMPEKACGKCKHFFASSSLGAAGGDCTKLKTGTNITKDPPVFVSEGEANYQTEIRRDASKCTYYEEMELVDTDIGQAFDPRYSRHVRQMMKE